MGWLPRLLQRDAAHLSDEQAMARVRAHGDHAAFARLVGRWETPVRRLCVRMTGDEHRGEDLAQDAFARVFANRHRYEDGRRFSTWLWRIALNLCYEHARRSTVRGELPLDDRCDARKRADESGPHEHAAEAERAQLVRDALAQLPEAYRTVVVLREYENLKFREIAEVLNVPEGTVKWRMAEAMDRLGRQLRPVVGEIDEANEGGDDARPAEDAGPVTIARVAL